MNRYAKPSNFAHPIRTPLLRQHFVYRAYNAAGELLYIGCSRNWQKRLAEHKVSRARWYPEIASIRLEGPYNYETARQVEYDAIESERSLHNYSSERRAIDQLHSDVVNFHFARLRAAGLPLEDAIHEAAEIGREVVPYEGLAPMRIDDLTVPMYRRIAADHMAAIGGAA